MNIAKQAVIQARKLISGGFSKKALCRNDGKQISSFEATALYLSNPTANKLSFCVVGACMVSARLKAPNDLEGVTLGSLVEILRQGIISAGLCNGVVNFNDDHTQEEVLAMFDSIIEKMED